MRLKQENAKERASGRARRASIFGEDRSEESNFQEEKRVKAEKIAIMAARFELDKDLFTGEKRG